MKKLSILLPVFVMSLFFSGCATWEGLKSDSSYIWEVTKEASQDTWESTKETAKEVTE